MPEGLDPDDVVKQGPEAYQKCLDASMPLIDYKLHAIERKYDLTKKQDKRSFISEALQIIGNADSEAVKEELLRKLRDKAGVSYHSLERDLQGIATAPKTVVATPQVKINEASASGDKRTKAIRFILAAKLFSMPYAKEYDVSKLSLEDESHIVVAQYIQEREENGERIRPGELFELLEEGCKELNEILDLNYEDKLSGEVAERFFEDSIRVIELEDIETEIQSLNARYNEETDDKQRKEIAAQLMQRMMRRNQLNQKRKK